MLHVVINTHGADTCALRSDENREPMIAAFRTTTNIFSVSVLAEALQQVT